MAVEFTLPALWSGLRATSPAEWCATGFGVVYIVLIIQRIRWAWLAGGASSLIFSVLFARSSLPMQSLLQAFYVAAAIYGWCSWTPASRPQRIGTWNWRGHLFTVAACLLVSLGLRPMLAGESAFPFVDSLVACCGLFATWLVSRVYLENWAYWIVIDIVSIWLCLSQGLLVTACLFVIYTVMAMLGLRSWWQIHRRQPA